MKMSSARQVGFRLMINRSIFLCVCSVIYIYVIEKAVFHLYECTNIGGGVSKIITMMKAVSLHWERDRWELQLNKDYMLTKAE